MKGVLLNENLPARLATILAAAGMEAKHVSDCGLEGKSDSEVWNRAQLEGLAVMTKDSDYVDLALSRREGKVILISTGNMRLASLLAYDAKRTDLIVDFLRSDERIVSI